MISIRKIGSDTKLDRILNRDYVSITRTGYVEVGQDKFCMPVYYEDFEEQLRKFEVYDDDVFITGHPKTGTTWTQEMVWLIVNNLNYEAAAQDLIIKRSPQLELCSLFDFNYFLTHECDGFFADCYNYLLRSRRPRCIKSHLHWSLLPEQIREGTKQPKIIYVLRNARDTCISYYYHCQSYESYTGTFEDYCELFLGGRVCFGPFWKQVLSYWEQKDRSNILFLRYNEMKNDLHAVIRKVANFLEKPLTESQVEKLAEHLSFGSMKTNPTLAIERFSKVLQASGIPSVENKFVRSGKTGSYKCMMSPELIQRFEAWTRENLESTGLSVE